MGRGRVVASQIGGTLRYQGVRRLPKSPRTTVHYAYQHYTITWRPGAHDANKECRPKA